MIDDTDFRIICEQHRMSMPNEIYLCETEDETLWCEDDTTDYGSGVRYIRADIHEAEVQALKRKAWIRNSQLRDALVNVVNGLKKDNGFARVMGSTADFSEAIKAREAQIAALDAELKEQADD